MFIFFRLLKVYGNLKQNKETSAVESSSWLLDYEPSEEPAVEVVDYWFNYGADLVRQRRKDLCGINETSIALPTAFFDAIFNALHQ